MKNLKLLLFCILFLFLSLSCIRDKTPLSPEYTFSNLYILTYDGYYDMISDTKGINKSENIRIIYQARSENILIVQTENEENLQILDYCSDIERNKNKAYELLDDKLEWNLRAIWADSSYIMGWTGTDVRIIIIDSGLPRDFEANPVWKAIDTTMCDIAVLDSNSQYIYDDLNHGSHIAGIICASPAKPYPKSTPSYIRGVAPDARVGMIKMFGKAPYTSTVEVIMAIDMAIGKLPDVISISWGGLTNALLERAYFRNIAVIAASGNSAQYFPMVLYPAKHAEVISVGAVDSNLNRCSFSSYGNELDIMAPGTGILSYDRFGLPLRMTGTSMASPHVAGAVAIFIEQYKINHGVKTVPLSIVYTALRKTAIDMSPAGWDEKTGFGLLNIKSLISDGMYMIE